PRVPSFGNQFATALGQGLSEGLNAGIAEHHERKKATNTANALATAIGKPELAQVLSQFRDPKIQQGLVDLILREQEMQAFQQGGFVPGVASQGGRQPSAQMSAGMQPTPPQPGVSAAVPSAAMPPTEVGAEVPSATAQP